MMRLAIFILIIFLISSGGCVTLKQPNMKIEHYTLEYDALLPVTNTNLNPVQAALKVERFSIAPVYNTSRIVYRDQEFKRSSYFYHKWKSNPADLVSYFLTRDIRESGLFTAVNVPDSKITHTHIVEGLVDEFLEWDSKDKWEAVLSMNVTLLDAVTSDISKRVIFQQKFSSRKTCKEKHPKALAQAMSQAMAEVSENICLTIHEALAGK
jgi:ABC-type uncharacterized transport system auxiliary subunit